jgi:structural maintenance of chromosome 1
MAPEERRGRVVRLEVENFKSYRGLCRVGPFHDFTTVIGPNGSGKSNLMDAISFVLGVKTGVLRGANLRELLYANAGSGDPADAPRRGGVALVFAPPEGGEVRFERAIAPSGGGAGGDAYASAYKLDGRPVAAEAYHARLESYGILVRARNFLVFQVSAWRAVGGGWAFGD